MLSVIVSSVVMLNVMAPLQTQILSLLLVAEADLANKQTFGHCGSITKFSYDKLTIISKFGRGLN